MITKLLFIILVISIILPKELANSNYHATHNISTTAFFETITEEPPVTTPKLDLGVVVEYKDVVCLAKVIYYEARDEKLPGKLAVANVTLNRLNDPEFKTTICDVVYQRSKTVCQYSWTCWEKGKNPPNNAEWNDSIALSIRILTDLHHKDNTNGSLYFKHKNLRNTRNKSNIIIGNHVFYRTKSAK